MTRAVLHVMLICGAACSTSPPPLHKPAPLPAAPHRPAPRLTAQERLQVEWLLRALVDARTALQIERRLTADYSRAELARVGFEEVSLGQCITRLAAAIVAQRERPLEHATEAELDAAAQLHFAAQREVLVGRSAGTVSCMPTTR